MAEKETKEKNRKRKWRLRDAKWENFQVDLSERDWEDGSVNDVDELNEKFIGNVKETTACQIGFVRVSKRKRVCKPWWNDDIRDARKERKRLNKVCRMMRKKATRKWCG